MLPFAHILQTYNILTHMLLVFDIRMIILVLCRRTNAERQRIMLAYKKKYEKVRVANCASCYRVCTCIT